ncbi:MAG: gliding motility protein [Armatimonadetes bacterium]|nr:gliding motility protein [Armatimonadota bacterium]
MEERLRKMKPAELERQVKSLLVEPIDDRELRARLEELAGHFGFSGLTSFWGPRLFQRNRLLFRPLILARFGTHQWRGGWKWSPVRWSPELESWLRTADAADELELTRRLLEWRLLDRSGWNHRKAQPLFRQELRARIRPELTPGQRGHELRKLDSFLLALDEETALELYRQDPRAAAPFILKHMPWIYGKPVLWEDLFRQAVEGKDEDFAWKLYRRQVDYPRWEKDALELCRTISAPDRLLEALEQRHPASARGNDMGTGMLRLLEQRGREVLPYVFRHLRDVWKPWLGRGSYGKLLELARQREWLDLWSALLRVCADPGEFNREVRGLAENRSLTEQEVMLRLLSLAGISREWNGAGFGIAQVHLLEEATALALYERSPTLLRGPFRTHLQISPWGPGYPKLVRLLLQKEDEELLEFLASRYLAFPSPPVEVGHLADHYARLKDAGAFARRAAGVLGRVPAYLLFNYHEVIRKNRLARLLFERSAEDYLEDPRAVADLIEGSEIHVQALGYRVLGLADPRASSLAVEHLALLLGTLLRPLHRPTRVLALRALERAASTDLEVARRVLRKARQAMALPDKRYPKEKLLGLIGAILGRFPDLRGPCEQPMVYRAS